MSNDTCSSIGNVCTRRRAPVRGRAKGYTRTVEKEKKEEVEEDAKVVVATRCTEGR